MAATFYSAAYVPPSSVWDYNAQGITSSNGLVDVWPNQGREGTDYNLVPDTNMSRPLFYANNGPNNRAYVRFQGGDVLRQLTTSGIYGMLPRTFILVYRLATNTARNILGQGQPANYKLLDLLTSNSTVAVHTYGPAVSPGNTHAVGTWGITVISFISGAGMSYEIYNGADKTLSGGYPNFETVDTPLRVGGGYYSDYNIASTLDIARVIGYRVYLTPPEVAAKVAELKVLYGI